MSHVWSVCLNSMIYFQCLECLYIKSSCMRNTLACNKLYVAIYTNSIYNRLGYNVFAIVQRIIDGFGLIRLFF